MARFPDSRFGWICVGVAAGAWIYAVIVGFALMRLPWPSSQSNQLAAWVAIPVQLPALLLVVALLARRDSLQDRERRAWWWVLVFTALSPMARYLWNVVRLPSDHEELGIADAVYLADYWSLTIAFAIWFVRAGGSLLRGRTWLDALTMIIVLLVGLWSSYLGPSVTNGTGHISSAATFAYSMTIVCMMSMAALLCLQLPTFRGSTALLCLVGAGIVDVTWDIMWMASWLTDRDFVGPFYNYGDIVCFAGVSSAVAATQFQNERPHAGANPERQVDSFLPALAVLVAIALVASSVASTRRWDAWILVGLVALCALLLVTRQRSVHAELRALHRALATREADARLTELVRRSADLILVVGADGIVTFASPATEKLLGVPVSQVQDAPAAALFGPDHSAELDHLLRRVRIQPAAHAGTELHVRGKNGESRVFKVTMINQLTNRLINGIVMTLTDVTEQRVLEREVLDVASREQVRLSGEIHDGLGQELVGIAMLLHGAATARDADATAMRIQLQSIVGQINRVVVAARDLARGLSPLSVVRGSLSGALQRLVPESNAAFSVRLDVDPAFDERIIDDFRAEHLYRIAQEAVSNAVHHSGCTQINIGLHRADGALVLDISDNGRGFDTLAPGNPGLGLRLMEYRTRIIGGTLELTHVRDAGTRVAIVVPLGITGRVDPRHH